MRQARQNQTVSSIAVRAAQEGRSVYEMLDEVAAFVQQWRSVKGWQGAYGAESSGTADLAIEAYEEELRAVRDGRDQPGRQRASQGPQRERDADQGEPGPLQRADA